MAISNPPTSSAEAVPPSVTSKLWQRKWSPVSAIVVTLVAFFASQVIGILILTLYASLHGMSGSVAQDWLTSSIGAEFALTLIIEVIAVGIIFYFLKGRKAQPADIGLVRPQWLDILRVLIGFAVYFALYVGLATVVKALVPTLNLDQQQDVGFKSATTGLQLALTFVSLAILPPFAEEIMFRGFLYTGLRTRLKPLIAALITSALFATAHLQFGSNAPLLWVAFIDTFVLSMVMVYMREKYNTLWPCIGLHMLKNTLAFLTLFVFIK